MNIEVEIGTSTNKDSKDSKSANKDSKGHQVTWCWGGFMDQNLPHSPQEESAETLTSEV
jgi:hypothetical protein